MPTRPPTARLIPTLRRAVLASPDAGPTDGQLLSEFVRVADADAFAALVRRHGPMVLGVCRRLAGNPHDADDAFQAVFLVLARRAGTVRPREQVGNWLYGVAYRTALKARAVRARRRVRESQVDPMPHPQAPPPDAWSDLRPVIDAELARLPDKLRLPVVLCDLEGRAQREVARQLGLPPATLANRLASARRTLARRLTDRGVTLSGGALAALVSANAASAAVPPTLAAAAVKAAGLVAAGGALTGVVPAQVVYLSEGVIRMMLLTKLKAVTVALLVVFTGGLGALPVLAAADDPAGRPAAGARPALGPNLTDEEFLRRVCLDLRGARPSDVEVRYFVADADPAKRMKVVRWLTEPGDVNLEARLRLEFTNPAAETQGHALTVDKEYIELPIAGKPGLAITQLARPEPLRVQVGEVKSGTPLKTFVDLDAPHQGGLLGLTFADEPRVWSVELQDNQPGVVTELAWFEDRPNFYLSAKLDESDEQFLSRVCQDVRGGPPTAIEKEYFLADQDPNKREKLLDTFLKDPEVAKKLGAEWKQKMLGTADRLRLHYKLYQRQRTDALRIWLKAAEARPDRFEALLGQLLDGKRTDDQVLDALCAAVLGRLPTESERKLVLATVAKAPDKAAAWREVIAALGGTEEAKKHAEKK